MPVIEKLNYSINPDLVLKIDRLELPSKGITVLQGSSGSGKSTFIRVLLGLLPCKDLVWKISEKNLAELPTEERNLSVVFQDYDLFPHMTVLENLKFTGRARKLNQQFSEKQITELTSRLEIHSILNRKNAVLSGGEKQRVALARSLMGNPEFLFLDEPFSGLDETLKDKARQLLKEVVNERNIPVLLVTHDNEDKKILADKNLILKDGKISEA